MITEDFLILDLVVLCASKEQEKCGSVVAQFSRQSWGYVLGAGHSLHKNGNQEGQVLSKEQENSKTILAIFRAIEERDAAQFSALLQPDFKIHWPRSLPYGGTFRGVEPQPRGWGATWQPLQPTEAERRMDPQVIAAHSDDVVVLWHQRGRSGDGESIDEEVLGLYRFREGKLARAQMFYFDTVPVANFLAKAQP